MILTLKNKMILGMEGLIKENAEVGGIPDKFLYTRKEFGSLLVELHEVGKADPNIKITHSGGSIDMSMRIYRHKLTLDNINELVDQWAKKEYTISYKDIPIILDTRNI